METHLISRNHNLNNRPAKVVADGIRIRLLKKESLKTVAEEVWLGFQVLITIFRTINSLSN
jgi:hypothetical protein